MMIEENCDENINAKPFNRLSQCEVCSVNEAKYTCPKCEVKTCCLPCVNIHKKELECDGIRDRTKFIPIQKFTNTDFYNDYAFLEECSRFVYGKKRNIAKRYTNIDKPLPNYLSRLKRLCRDRGTVIFFLPEHFVRRKTNSTRVNKGGQILWRVDFVFGDKLYTHKGAPIPETTRLCKLFQEKLETDDANLDCYKAAGITNVRMLLKAERIKGCSAKFYELDPGVSLKENLKGKCVVEYPTVYVLLKDHSYGLEIVHSDDEVDAEIQDVKEENKTQEQENGEEDKSENIEKAEVEASRLGEDKEGRRVGMKRRRERGELTTVRVVREERERIQREMDEDKKKKPRNLLFVTGYSSDEDLSEDDKT